MKDASLTAVPEYGASELVNIVKEQAERIKLLESEREKINVDLKDAILECAREEVIRAIKEIPYLGSSDLNNELCKKSKKVTVNESYEKGKTKDHHLISSRLKSGENGRGVIPRLQSWPKYKSKCWTTSSTEVTRNSAQQRPNTSVGRKNKSRPKTSWNNCRQKNNVHQKDSILAGAEKAYADHRPITVSFVSRGWPNRTFLPDNAIQLEQLEEEGLFETENTEGIALSSLNWLQKSAKLIKENTGRNSSSIFTNDLFKQSNCSSGFSAASDENDKTLDQSTDCFYPENQQLFYPPERSMKRPQSWPMPRRAIKSSNSSTRPRQRPTTALERRKSRPRTSEVYRTKVEKFGRNLLGPINFDAEPRKDPVPHSLKGNEWENEIARNILSLYSNKIKSEIKQAGQSEVMSKMQEGAYETLEKRLGEEKPSEGGATSSCLSGSFNETTSIQSTPTRHLSKDITKHCMEHSVNESHTKDEEDSSQNGNYCFANIRNPKTILPGLSKSTLEKVNKKSLASIKMIWLEGTGMAQVKWSSLECYRTGKINIWNDLATLEERGKYLQYVKTLESLLCSGSWNNTEEETYKNTSYHLWRQLVLTCNSFGSRLINQQKYPKALEILEKAQGLISYDKMVDPDTANELKAFVKDAYGHYYAKRNKPNAALQYVTAAVNMHRRRNDPLNVSKCRLHSAYVLFQLGRYDESARTMKDILDMVENGSLQSQGNSDDYQLVLLVAVTYHNIAVHQLTVGRIGDACISSQNARRLARLCLSVSSRYIHNFEATHKRALSELTSVMEKEQNKDQVVTFKKLINELFQ
mmetsp:Transcript_33599/g.49314  ORF Transcript_33599/g.49314 Transcript_33599/m.49314 type:complete len:810 (-) Transcript_33599:90-2519(-)